MNRRTSRKKAATALLVVLGTVAATTLAAKPAPTSRGIVSAFKARGHRYLGPAQHVGNGKARSFVVLARDGTPLEIGVKFSKAALKGLPEAAPEGEAGAEAETEYLLPLPPEAAALPFNHITMDWNPQGHPPPGVYDAPHFDFHFYMISQEQRDAITPTAPDGEKPPAPQFIPQDYVPIPGIVPRMGAHWVDPTGPEFSPGGTLTSTFIYGFFQGNMVFLEPMVSKAFLETKPNVVQAIKQPVSYAVPGYYPTEYKLRYNSARKEYTFSLQGMVLR